MVAKDASRQGRTSFCGSVKLVLTGREVEVDTLGGNELELLPNGLANFCILSMNYPEQFDPRIAPVEKNTEQLFDEFVVCVPTFRRKSTSAAKLSTNFWK